MEDTLLVTDVTRKATRLTEMLQPTPQQLVEVELSTARKAMDSYYTETHTTDVPTLETTDEEITTENQDSIEPIKRSNPKVGRTIGPKRKGDAQITKVQKGE